MRRLIARLYQKIAGWRVVGGPPEQSAVIIGAFHTSNWDFPTFLMVKWYTGMRAKWLGKDTLFRGPFDFIFRMMGGIPVDRRRPGRLVDQMRELFESTDHVLLVITPEGTRGATSIWKSGFYRIARGANVPVVLGFVDYRTKTVGFGPSIELTGEVSADMGVVRAFYADKAGLRPNKQGPVRLAEESG
ncbi:MAG: lysophospholipid acyltransferase family protein [Acidimicrobiia bacterium]